MVSKFCFIHTWGNDPIWRAYFSDGLKPPTRCLLKWYGAGGIFFGFSGLVVIFRHPSRRLWRGNGKGPVLATCRFVWGPDERHQWLIIPEKRGLISWSFFIGVRGHPSISMNSGKFGQVSVWSLARWTRFGRITIRETVNCELLTIPKPINLRRLACWN